MNGYKYLKLGMKNKIIAILACFLSVVFVLVYSIIVPTVRQIKEMRKNIEAQREDLEKKYIKGQSLRQLTENLIKIEPELKLLDQIFINQNRELEFITSIENQASKNRVSQKINLSEPQKYENWNFQKAGLQIYAKAGFIDLVKYLNGIEHLNYYINVQTLELFPASEEQPKIGAKQSPSGIKNLNMYIEADTYWN